MGIALLIMLNYTCAIIFIIKRLSSFKNDICYDIYDIVVIPFLFLLDIDISDYVSYIMENIFGFTIVILCDVFLIRNKVFVSCIFFVSLSSRENLKKSPLTIAIFNCKCFYIKTVKATVLRNKYELSIILNMACSAIFLMGALDKVRNYSSSHEFKNITK